MVEGLFAVLAQWDNDQRSERTTAGMQKALEHGRWLWRPPIGYRKPPQQHGAPSLVLDDAVAPWFDERLSSWPRAA